MGTQSKLEQIALEVRKNILTINTFNNFDINNNYSATHTNAKSDEKTPNHGKGTGVYMDTTHGGSQQDKYGVPNAAGSGRIGNVTNNKYNAENGYQTPDTSGNIGQVTL